MLDAEIHGLPLWNWLLQGAGLCTSLYGAVLNARMRREGFMIWIGSNIFLATLHAMTGLWLLVVLDTGYFVINVMGLRRWNARIAAIMRPVETSIAASP